MKTAFLLVFLAVATIAMAQKPEASPVVWGDSTASGGQIVRWSKGTVTDLTPLGQTWRLWGARLLPAPKGSKAPVELWGAVKVPQGWKIWKTLLEPEATHLRPHPQPRVFDDLVAMESSGAYTALVTDNAQGPQLFVVSSQGTREWAWGPNVTLTGVAVRPDGQVATVGYRQNGSGWLNAQPFLWVNGNQVPAPEGWRGLLNNVLAGPKGFQAVGRGGPGTQEPVQTLWFDQGHWLTLKLPSDGNFAEFLGVLTPAQKSSTTKFPQAASDLQPILFGALAKRDPQHPGRLQPWRWQKGKVSFWDTGLQILAFGPASFGTSAWVCAEFQTEQGPEWRLWDGVGHGPPLKGWPQHAVPRALTLNEPTPH